MITHFGQVSERGSRPAGALSLAATMAAPAAALAMMTLSFCARDYQQCGGDKWNGRRCCAGALCIEKDEFYSQCLPPSDPRSGVEPPEEDEPSATAGGYAGYQSGALVRKPNVQLIAAERGGSSLWGSALTAGVRNLETAKVQWSHDHRAQWRRICKR